MASRTPKFTAKIRVSKLKPLLYRWLLAILLAGVAVFWGFSTPNGFLKAANMKVVDGLPAAPEDAANEHLRAAELLQGIPYDQSSDSSPWNIDLDDRVRLVFEHGHGDCSYKSRALARVLQLKQVPFRVIWIMDRFAISSGQGHTVVECPIEIPGFRGFAIIDMLEGGVPCSGNRPIRLDDLLRHEPIDGFRINSLNSRVDDSSVHYGDSLKNSVVGVSTSSDYATYFGFLDHFHVNLGHPKLEKLVYNLGASILGVFPSVYVTREEIQRYGGGFLLEIAIAKILIWAARLLALLTLLDLIAKLAGAVHRGLSRDPPLRTTRPAPPP